MANTQGYQSNINPQVFNTEYRRIEFIVQSMLSGIRTSLPCRVEYVTNNGGIAPIGYVNIRPLIQQIDGNGNLFDHDIIYNVPYMRLQGGGNAVIIDPKIGDIGMFSVADRDISGLKNTGAQSGPSSGRQFDMSDAIYHQSIISVTPTQYIQFNDAGIKIHSPGMVRIEADNVQVHATTSYSWDAGGFGERWTHTGGSNYTHTTWQLGAVVTTVANPINPPDGS